MSLWEIDLSMLLVVLMVCLPYKYLPRYISFYISVES